MALRKKQSTGPEPIENFQNKGWQSTEGIFITSSIIMTHDSSAFHNEKGEGQIQVSCYPLSADKSCPPRVGKTLINWK